jgi:hypothetical protein
LSSKRGDEMKSSLSHCTSTSKNTKLIGGELSSQDSTTAQQRNQTNDRRFVKVRKQGKKCRNIK